VSVSCTDFSFVSSRKKNFLGKKDFLLLVIHQITGKIKCCLVLNRLELLQLPQKMSMKKCITVAYSYSTVNII